EISERQHYDREAPGAGGPRAWHGRRRARCWQIGDTFGAQCIDPHGPSDILDTLLAPILERVRQLVADLVSHHSRDAAAATLRQRLQPRRHVHAVDEDVVFLNDHVAEVDADTKPDAPLIGHLRLAVEHSALHIYSTAHGVDHARKFRQQAVAGVLYGAAPVL